MPLLKRPPEPVFDGHLTYFTVSQAHEFRRLVAASFAEVGREVDVYPDRIEDRAGTTIGLWNIGALCAGTNEREWPQLIDEHVRLVATPARELSDVTEAELTAGLTLRLVAAASVPDPDSVGYARLALQSMLQAAFLGFHDEVGRLSPDVDWVRKQKWVQATSSAGGKPRVLRGTGLREALASF